MAIQQARREAAEAASLALEEAESQDVAESSDEEGPEDSASDTESEDDMYLPLDEETEDGLDPRAQILSVVKLEELFHKYAPELSGTR